jgi:hypothetical protein
LMEAMVSMESMVQPRAAPAASPLLFSQSSNQIHIFCVSPPTHREIARVVLYIVSFRSRRVHGVQDCIKMMHEGEMGPTAWSRGGPVLSPLFPPSLRSLLTSSFTVFYLLKKDVTNCLGPFDIRKVPEIQKHGKTRKSASQC